MITITDGFADFEDFPIGRHSETDIHRKPLGILIDGE